MENKIILTVFTPAYNRAHTLLRTYESLRIQRCKDFIWMIVDDGSVDNTAELVAQWQLQDNGFEIQYIYKENGGMHTAHNTAYEHIKTELNVCIDSDDMMAVDAVEKILNKYTQVYPYRHGILVFREKFSLCALLIFLLTYGTMCSTSRKTPVRSLKKRKIFNFFAKRYCNLYVYVVQ